jgi:proton-translocating NADH-quinone oxidoreductase chain N
MMELVVYLFSTAFLGLISILTLDLLVRRRLNRRSYSSGTISSIVYLAFLYLAWRLWSGVQSSGEAVFSIALGPVSSSLQVGSLGLYVFGIAAFLGLVSSVYSIKYMENFRNAAIFHSLIILLGVNIFGIAVAGDLLTLFIFWEGMSVCAYGLVAFRKTSWEALEASMKYLLLAGVGSLTSLYGIAVIYSVTGTLNFQSLSGLVIAPNGSILFGLGLVIAGFGVEAAIAPLHTWLPDAHPAAPSPMSALLSGIVIEVGSFAIIRTVAGSFLSQDLVTILQPLFVGFAVLTMLVGNLSAFWQDDLKRLLAFSSIAQIGYILLGISTFTAAGISASMFHVWNHALLKGLFFLLAGIVSFSLGTRSLNDMAGVGRKWPVLGLLLSLNALAMTGVPPFGMFWSEFLVILSAIQTRSSLFYAASLLMLLNIAFSIAYYFRIIRRVSFDKPSDFLNSNQMKPRSAMMLTACAALLGLSLITGFYPDLFYAPALQGVRALIAS